MKNIETDVIVVAGGLSGLAAAMSCVAGLAMTVPGLMSEIDSSYLQYVNEASAQLAFVVVLSAILTPWLVRKIVTNKSSKNFK